MSQDPESAPLPPGELSPDEGLKLAQPGTLTRARCPLCKHSTYNPEQVETGWCLWCKAYTFVGRDGVDRRGVAAEQVNAPKLVYSGAVWQHGSCGGRNFDELYAYQPDPDSGVWRLTLDPVVRPSEDPSVPRCEECGSRVGFPWEISGYWAMVVAPIERAGAGERVARMALPLSFTNTVPPGGISPQP